MNTDGWTKQLGDLPKQNKNLLETAQVFRGEFLEFSEVDFTLKEKTPKSRGWYVVFLIPLGAYLSSAL